MSEIRTERVALPADGPLVLEYTMYYHSGSEDHSRSGRRFEHIELSDGTRYYDSDIENGEVPGVSIERRGYRTKSSERSTRILTIEELYDEPLVIQFDVVDEYHGDYWNNSVSNEDRVTHVRNGTVRLEIVSRLA